MKPLKESPSQTAGPYVHIGCTPNAAGINLYTGDLGATMITGPVEGQEINFKGIIYDGAGAPLVDAMVEIWQADAAGLYPSENETRGKADPYFTGWGRTACHPETGTFQFNTIKPGAVPWVDGRLQAPHITLWIVARGINVGLQTRIYFADEPAANADDPILSQIDTNRVQTLLARGAEKGSYVFDVNLQGANETVFFDI